MGTVICHPSTDFAAQCSACLPKTFSKRGEEKLERKGVGHMCNSWNVCLKNERRFRSALDTHFKMSGQANIFSENTLKSACAF